MNQNAKHTPELLQVAADLEAIASLICARQHARCDVRPDQWWELFYCCNQVRAAIAKARGQEQGGDCPCERAGESEHRPECLYHPSTAGKAFEIWREEHLVLLRHLYGQMRAESDSLVAGDPYQSFPDFCREQWENRSAKEVA